MKFLGVDQEGQTRNGQANFFDALEFEEKVCLPRCDKTSDGKRRLEPGEDGTVDPNTGER